MLDQGFAGAGAELDALLQPASWDTTSFPAAENATFAGSAWAPGTAVPSPGAKKKSCGRQGVFPYSQYLLV